MIQMIEKNFIPDKKKRIQENSNTHFNFIEP